MNNTEDMIVHNNMCKSLMSIENNFLTVFSLCYEDDYFTNECEECFGTGVYEITNNKLKKVKSYSEDNLSMNNIQWMDYFYLGMPIEEFFDKNKLKVQEKPLFEYGYDSEEIGYEILKEHKPEYFIVADENRIVSAFILNENISIHNISTSWTIKEVFEKFPNSKLNIDLISEWEYIYLKKYNLKLIFKTTNSNRIGVYEKDFEKGAIKIQRENKKIDLMQIIKKPSS